MVLPSSLLTYAATQWAHRHRDKKAVIAFRKGLLPVVFGLVISTSYLMNAHLSRSEGWRVWLLSTAVALTVWLTRVHLLLLLALGASLGAMGWV